MGQGLDEIWLCEVVITMFVLKISHKYKNGAFHRGGNGKGTEISDKSLICKQHPALPNKKYYSQ